jgi:putative phosphoribosyl transferase
MTDADLPFPDRTTAGCALAEALAGRFAAEPVVVLALPRGGVPVGYAIARRLRAPLDILLVRKLGVPGQPELAAGALASGGIQVLNRDIMHALGLTESALAPTVAAARAELERRERVYRGSRPALEVAGHCVILVDDGVATGATVRAAVAALRTQHPARVVVAVPVGAPDTVAILRGEADEVVCLATPEPFWGVGRWYRNFEQVSDEEVGRLLAQASEDASHAC